MKRSLLKTGAMIIIAITVSCDSRETDTRTFLLAHMEPDNALLLIEPYLRGDATAARRTTQPRALTITAPPARLEQIAELLSRYDVPAADVRLRFQLIEADGFTAIDPAIADVEAALRELFRFSGYRLAGEAMVRTKPHSFTSQRLLGFGSVPINLQVGVDKVNRAENGRSSVELSVVLRSELGGGDDVLSTSVVVPHGQTVVLGTTRPFEDRGALILVVRPEIE